MFPSTTDWHIYGQTEWIPVFLYPSFSLFIMDYSDWPGQINFADMSIHGTSKRASTWRRCPAACTWVLTLNFSPSYFVVCEIRWFDSAWFIASVYSLTSLNQFSLFKNSQTFIITLLAEIIYSWYKYWFFFSAFNLAVALQSIHFFFKQITIYTCNAYNTKHSLLGQRDNGQSLIQTVLYPRFIHNQSVEKELRLSLYKNWNNNVLHTVLNCINTNMLQ